MRTRRSFITTTPLRLLAGLLLIAAGLALAAPGAAAADDVHAWRAARRQSLRARCGAAAKALGEPGAAPAQVSILVIPVDFADHRLPDGWDPATLAPRLGATGGQSLRHYFDVASAGRCTVLPVTAPVARLPGEARDYSDVGLNGFTRTQALARAAIASVVGAGFDLRLADNDGPDGRPGTPDDDGWVDGVLILHAEQGQENDADSGIIQALQYILAEPVFADGVGVSAYAVASLASGPGIWAHETAHLLGMEDRYDPLLPPVAGAGDLAGAGGLGVFSLMASGALGTGGGWQPALPDAYSRAAVGWADVATLDTSPATGDTLGAAPAPAGVARLWTRTGTGPEFLLLEARDPAAVAPFDAAVPAGLCVLHVDEDVAEGAWAEDGPGQWHLRARLVEADGSDGLRQGDDAGNAGDVFPGAAGVAALTPATTPSTDGYAGASGVALTGIAPVAGGMVVRASAAPSPWLTFDASWGSGLQSALSLAARVHDGEVTALTLRVEAVGATRWGSFEGGASAAEVPLVAGTDGLWRPVSGPVWEMLPGLPPDAWDTFRYTLSGSGVATVVDDRPWVWGGTFLTLAFEQSWPGSWETDQPDGPGTSWRRWTGADSPAAGGSPVLVCTGDAAAGADWPAVSYSNGGHATLTSGPLAPGVLGVRLLHWVDVEALPDGTPMDGASIAWVGPDGLEMPATPLHGWPARVDPTSSSALRGRGAFGGPPGEFVSGDEPLWRTDIIPVPATGPGPWRLRLEFAANGLWRGRGWLVGRCEALTDGPLTDYDEDPRWTTALAWDWTWPSGVSSPRVDVQARALPDGAFTTILADEEGPVPAARILPLLDGPAGARHEVRVVGPTLWGSLALLPVAVYADGGEVVATTLDAPWPNPAKGDLHFTLRIPDGHGAVLKVHDLAGRLVHERAVAPGTVFALWDGSDDRGQRLPSGTYFLTLDGAGAPVTRKVVLWH